MTYQQALDIAKDAVRFLEEGEGNLSSKEMICHVAALHYATKKIAERNGVVLP